ncbi:MAG TPA: sugar phosphate isomerase/epimerase [Burkholderiales bacterium]|nr:sugar phosphate isomerase/epimerase [Burkholderiales bacterium]
MNQDNFGVDTVSLAGPLEAKLQAVRESGFTQIMLSARDLVEHPGGEAAAISAVRQSGLRVTGFQLLRDFEGLPGHLHAYKLDVAKSLLGMCRALGSNVILACSSTSAHASGDPEVLARDLRKLATLAVPLGIRVAYEALSWGKHVNGIQQAVEIVTRADRANLGLALDSFHMLAAKTDPDDLDLVDPEKVFIVQLSDFMWQELPSREERINTARHFRVFPGEGVHGSEVLELVRRLDEMGYRGDYGFEVFNDDYAQLPAAFVAARARASVKWLTDQVSRRSLPVRRDRARQPG